MGCEESSDEDEIIHQSWHNYLCVGRVNDGGRQFFCDAFKLFRNYQPYFILCFHSIWNQNVCPILPQSPRGGGGRAVWGTSASSVWSSETNTLGKAVLERYPDAEASLLMNDNFLTISFLFETNCVIIALIQMLSLSGYDMPTRDALFTTFK